jgi:hypothetical protein
MLDFLNVNWWAVVAAAVVQLVVGGIWNGLLFPQAFFVSHGLSGNIKPKPLQFALMAGFTVLSTYILAVLFENLFVASAVSGAVLAFWFWLAFMAPFIVGMGLATGRKQGMFLELGHTFFAIIFAGIVLGAWH